MRRLSLPERRARLVHRHFLAPTTARAVSARWPAASWGSTRPTRRPCSSPPAAVSASLRWRRSKRSLYEERSVLRMIGMRRTMFVLPLDLAAVVQAACSTRIAAAQRRRYAKLMEARGIARDGAAWLDAAGRETLAALAARGEAFAVELSADVPRLREKLTFGKGRKWAGSQSMTTWVLFLLAADRRIVRGPSTGTWTASQWRWVPVDSWFDAPLPPVDASAARVELVRRWLGLSAPARHRPRLVDGAHCARGRESPRGDRPGRGRARRRAAGARAARRRRASARLPIRSGAPARARPDDDGLEGARVVPRGARAVALRPERQRRSHRVVGRDASSAAGPSERTGRSSTGCSRTSARPRRRRSRPRPAGWRPGSATSGSPRASRPRSSASWWGRATRRCARRKVRRADSLPLMENRAVRESAVAAATAARLLGICPARGGIRAGGGPSTAVAAREAGRLQGSAPPKAGIRAAGSRSCGIPLANKISPGRSPSRSRAAGSARCPRRSGTASRRASASRPGTP